MFNKNSSQQVRNLVKYALETHKETWNEEYLCLPVYIGGSKKKGFAFLKDKIWLRIQGWDERLLAKSQKGVLVKVIAHIIPAYIMSCFYLTKPLCDELSAMISRFWRNQ